LLRPAVLVPARAAPPETGLGRVLWKAWYVNELYDVLCVRPIMWLSREVLWKVVDVRLLDGVGVHGAARLSRFAGWLGSRLQAGRLGVYVVVFVIGVLAVLTAATR
jgi:NADH-quinone oxidoreductase subunit L